MERVILAQWAGIISGDRTLVEQAMPYHPEQAEASVHLGLRKQERKVQLLPEIDHAPYPPFPGHVGLAQCGIRHHTSGDLATGSRVKRVLGLADAIRASGRPHASILFSGPGTGRMRKERDASIPAYMP